MTSDLGYYHNELMALELQPRHECCQMAAEYLFPPHKEGSFGKDYLTYKVHEQMSWYLDPGDEVNIDIDFCPWCGIHLPI